MTNLTLREVLVLLEREAQRLRDPRIKLSRATLYRRIATSEFPEAVAFEWPNKLWSRDQVMDWVLRQYFVDMTRDELMFWLVENGPSIGSRERSKWTNTMIEKWNSVQ